MPLKKYKAVTPSRRHQVDVSDQTLSKKGPFKPLLRPLPKTGGRNVHGRITSRARGGRHKRLYRLIDFKRRAHMGSGIVESLEYDPNRTAAIALIRYSDGKYAYILASQGLKVGDSVVSSSGAAEGQVKADLRPGCAMKLKDIPDGTLVHNVEFKPGGGGKMARAAGAYAQVAARDGDYVVLSLMSKEQRRVHGECMATIGAVSNPEHANAVLGKAGRKRWLGIRPTVRGIAKNPVDHPHGGRTNGDRHPVTPWGQLTKGKKTRKNKATSKFIIRTRHQRRKRG